MSVLWVLGFLIIVSITWSQFHREQVFANHQPAIEHLPITLLNLFIDIEFTGHSMEFEQKFGKNQLVYILAIDCA